jgi:hypothetical protein
MHGTNMILEAKAEDCCSRTYVLKLNNQAIGSIQGRFMSEGLDLALTGRQRLKLDKASWLSSHFQLKDAESDEVLVEARAAGMFRAGWNLTLASGPATFTRAGFFKTGYEIRRGGQLLGTVDRLGLCERGWRVQKISDDLTAPDLILAGVIYHIIKKREEQAAAAAHGS